MTMIWDDLLKFIFTAITLMWPFLVGIAFALACAAASPEVLWNVSTANAANSTTQFYGLPAINDDIAVVCADSVAIALSISSGSIVWAYNFDRNEPCQYSDLTSTTVVVASNGTVVALSAFSGYVLWTHFFQNPSPTVPARPVIVNDTVWFTVENGIRSTPLTILRLSDGTTIYQPEGEVAATRLWYLKETSTVLYVAMQGQNSTAQYLTSRCASTFQLVWRTPSPSRSFTLADGGGSVAFSSSIIAVMLIESQSGNPGIGVVNSATGAPVWDRFQWASTNNFDFSTTVPTLNKTLLSRVFTLESYGPSAFNQSLLTAYEASSGRNAWATSVETSLPNLLPAGDEAILAQGTTALVALNSVDGSPRWTLPFLNPSTEIGNSYFDKKGVCRVIVGSTVLQTVLALRC